LQQQQQQHHNHHHHHLLLFFLGLLLILLFNQIFHNHIIIFFFLGLLLILLLNQISLLLEKHVTSPSFSLLGLLLTLDPLGNFLLLPKRQKAITSPPSPSSPSSFMLLGVLVIKLPYW